MKGGCAWFVAHSKLVSEAFPILASGDSSGTRLPVVTRANRRTRVPFCHELNAESIFKRYSMRGFPDRHKVIPVISLLRLRQLCLVLLFYDSEGKDTGLLKLLSIGNTSMRPFAYQRI